jgi:hypothetical protein
MCWREPVNVNVNMPAHSGTPVHTHDSVVAGGGKGPHDEREMYDGGCSQRQALSELGARTNIRAG